MEPEPAVCGKNITDFPGFDDLPPAQEEQLNEVLWMIEKYLAQNLTIEIRKQLKDTIFKNVSFLAGIEMSWKKGFV